MPDDDAVVGARRAVDQVRRGPGGQGGDGTHRGTPTRKQRHGQVEGLGEAEDAVATADADVDVGGVVPGVTDDALAGGTVVGGIPDQASRMLRYIVGRDWGNGDTGDEGQ